MPIDRRDFIRATAAATAGAVAGIPVPGLAQSTAAADPEAAKLKWSKAPCRFCGTGCGVTVAVKDNRVVATHGDPAGRGQQGAELRQGLLPVEDHVRRGPPDDAAAAHEERPVREGRRVRARCPGTQAFDVMAAAVQARAQGEGADCGRHVRLGPVDGVGRLRGAQADEGRASAPTTSIPTPGTAWPRRPWASCAPSAWTSRWAATTTSRPPTPSCCGARTWRRCTRSCGPG